MLIKTAFGDGNNETMIIVTRCCASVLIDKTDLCVESKLFYNGRCCYYIPSPAEVFYCGGKMKEKTTIGYLHALV